MEEEYTPGTIVCDSCGHRFDAELAENYFDGEDTWKLCPTCMINHKEA
jgi:hypothetical protein